MAKIKTFELEGAALDWAVAKAVGAEQLDFRIVGCAAFIECIHDGVWERNWRPSAGWSQGGPLISDHVIMLQHTQGAMIGDAVGEWMATATYDDGLCLADTPLIAACRAIVAARLGDEVDVPDILMQT